MDIIEILYKRRSIRKYQDKEIGCESLELLVKAAASAPSASNFMPWEFIVVNDKAIMQKLRDGMYFGPYNAPAAIVVCSNLDLAPKGPYSEFWVQDCSAATENILIAATGMGLGTVWIGTYPNKNAVKHVQKVLAVPEHVIPLSVVYIGYPDEMKEPRTQYDAKRVYWQQYDPERKHRAKKKNTKYEK